MVITAALSWFFTRTPPSCETVAAAIALTLASRTIPSSCLSLISLSPHPGGHPYRSCAALLGASRTTSSHLENQSIFTTADYSLGTARLLLQLLLLFSD